MLVVTEINRLVDSLATGTESVRIYF